MKKFEKELLFSQVEDETTSNGNGSTGENAGEGENDAPEQEPVDEGAEADNNMYDGQDGSSSGQTPNGESYPTSGTVPIDPIEVVGSPTDPAEDDNNMYDGQDGSSSEQTPNGESDPTSGTVPIDPVEVVGYPTDPADTPSDAEGPEEEEEDVYYGEDSDINDNSAPDNEYEYGDDGEGDGNTNDDDTQSSTEQPEEDHYTLIDVPQSEEIFETTRPKPVPNGFCLIGCCQWALFRMFGKYPNFVVSKYIADQVTNNGFNGIGYSNKYEFDILKYVCQTLNASVSPILLENPVDGINNFRSYLQAGINIVCILSTSEDTEHAIVLINITPNGTYSAIDPVQDKTIFGSLTDQNIMQLYLIKKQ